MHVHFMEKDKRELLFKPPLAPVIATNRWVPPPPGWIKLNVDGAARDLPIVAGGWGSAS